MAIFASGNAPVVESEGVLTNPTAGTLAADTGAQLAGIYDVRVVVGGTAAAVWTINRRNAADDADVGDQPMLYTAANTSQAAQLTLTLEAGERVRITVGALTGTASGTITAEPLL